MRTVADAEIPATASSFDVHFDQWAHVYDTQANPLLNLEFRYLRFLLPPARGRDVVDLGCGTGRWMEFLQQQSPRSLVGLDRSAQMLARAQPRLDGTVHLVRSDARSIPLPNNSSDLLIASFLIGYLENLSAFAGEVARVIRPEGSVFLSDVDATTFAEMGWRRSFKAGDAEIELASSQRSVDEILTAFRDRGFDVVCLLQPPFGVDERAILAANGKSSASAIGNRSPIFITQLRKRSNGETRASWMTLRDATVAIGPRDATTAGICIEGDKVRTVSSRPGLSACGIDLGGYLVMPGLINAHDHLEFALFPRLGDGPYQNCGEWASDIHARYKNEIELHRAVPRRTRLWWGAIKNLLAGVTTVCHHNPFEAAFLDPDFPVRVLQDFKWAHSLAIDIEVTAKYRATPDGQPFIIHLAEGTNAASASELETLDKLGMLAHRTVVVHGLALQDQDVQLINRRGTSLIWCCSSTKFLYGRHHSGKFIRSLRNVAIGTDSSLTSAGDLLDEIRLIAAETDISTDEVWSLVLDGACDVLRLKAGWSRVLPDHDADLVAIRDLGLPPGETLVAATFAEVELVMNRGIVRLASPEIFDRLPAKMRDGLNPIDVAGTIRWIRAPIPELLADAEAQLGPVIHLGGRRMRAVRLD